MCSSTRSAIRKASVGEMPAAMIEEASRPFENGSPWLRSLMMIRPRLALTGPCSAREPLRGPGSDGEELPLDLPVGPHASGHRPVVDVHDLDATLDPES